MLRTLTAALAVALASAGPASAGHIDFEPSSAGSTSSTTYTTSAYDQTSTSGDVDVSCLDVYMGSGGVLNAHCNAERADGTIGHDSTNVDLDDHAGCDNDVLKWGHTGISSEATDIEAGLSSSGMIYEISGKCGGTESTLIVDGRFRNSSGSFAQD